jgi:F0F1-type ATP synthase membrane subunit b/b'
MEEYSKHAENILGIFTRRRTNISSSLSKRRMAEKAAEDVKESRKAIADYKQQIEGLEKEKEQALQEVSERWGELASQSKDLAISPAKKDVLIDVFGVAWLPYYLVKTEAGEIELPAFRQAKSPS